MNTPKTSREIAEEILNLTSHVLEGERWGDDTALGFNEDLVQLVIRILAAAEARGGKAVRDAVVTAYKTSVVNCLDSMLAAADQALASLTETE